jgi:hypothetical protein
MTSVKKISRSTAVVGVVIMKKFVCDLMDEVQDGGDYEECGG